MNLVLIAIVIIQLTSSPEWSGSFACLLHMLSLVTVLEGREAEEGAEKRKGKEEKGMGQEEVGGGGGVRKGMGEERRMEKRGREEGQLKGHGM